MNVPALLVRLYPPGIRERWGRDIEDEAASTGPRSWPDTVIGAGRIWLRPGDWPQTAPGQTCRVVVAAVVAVATAAVVLLRAAGTRPLTADPHQPATSAWLVPVLVGLALAALARLAAAVVRALTPPALASAALYAVAHSGWIHHPTGAARVLLLGYYWATVGFVGVRVWVLAVRVGRLAPAPCTRRLHRALLCVGTGLGLAAAQSLTPALHPEPVLRSAGLAVLAAVVTAVGLDLRRNPPGVRDGR